MPTTVASRRRPTLLYVVHRLPYPPDKGDRIRSYHLLRWLADRAAVHLACLADEPVSEAVREHLESLCDRLAIVPVGPARWARAGLSLLRGRTATEGAFAIPALRAVLRRWAAETDYAFALASSSGVAPYLRRCPERGVPMPVLIDLIDVDSQKWLDYGTAGRGPTAWLHRLEGRRLRRLELELSGWANAITLATHAEADLFRRCGARGSIHAICNGVDLETFQPQPQTEPGVADRGLVFIGVLDYRPNVDAVCWFCDQVWPAIHRLRPAAVFRVVGKRPTAAVRKLGALPGVELVGPVPDVRPYLARADAAVAPLRIARGVQNKVLEAMAMGKPAIVSSPVLAGLHATPDTHVLRADTPGQWVDATLRLLDDQALRHRLGTAARHYVEANHNWNRCLEALAPLLGLDLNFDLDLTPDSSDPSPADATLRRPAAAEALR